MSSAHLSRVQAADHYGLSLRALDAALARGTIPSFKIGARRVIPLAALAGPVAVVQDYVPAGETAQAVPDFGYWARLEAAG